MEFSQALDVEFLLEIYGRKGRAGKRKGKFGQLVVSKLSSSFASPPECTDDLRSSRPANWTIVKSTAAESALRARGAAKERREVVERRKADAATEVFIF